MNELQPLLLNSRRKVNRFKWTTMEAQSCVNEVAHALKMHGERWAKEPQSRKFWLSKSIVHKRIIAATVSFFRCYILCQCSWSYPPLQHRLFLTILLPTSCSAAILSLRCKIRTKTAFRQKIDPESLPKSITGCLKNYANWSFYLKGEAWDTDRG